MIMNPDTTATNAIATSMITIGCWSVVDLWSLCATSFRMCNIFLFKDIKPSEKRLII